MANGCLDPNTNVNTMWPYSYWPTVDVKRRVAPDLDIDAAPGAGQACADKFAAMDGSPPPPPPLQPPPGPSHPPGPALPLVGDMLARIEKLEVAVDMTDKDLDEHRITVKAFMPEMSKASCTYVVAAVA